MPVETQISLSLDKLTCHREDDGQFAGSEPYIWPALIAFNTLSGLEFGQAFPETKNARIVIRDGIEGGDSASIPPEVGELSLKLISAAAPKLKILVLVLLFEEDANTLESMRAGFEAFKQQLLGALILATNAGTKDPSSAEIEALKSSLSEKITAAVTAKLSTSDKIRIGIFGQDELLGTEFVLRPGRNSNIFLTYGDPFFGDRFSISGRLTVQPEELLPPDRCANFQSDLTKANEALNRLLRSLRKLQAELRTASAQDKPRLIIEIEEFKEGEITNAQKVLDAARTALAACRARTAREFMAPGTSTLPTR
jgi:hypothetical protein